MMKRLTYAFAMLMALALVSGCTAAKTTTAETPAFTQYTDLVDYDFVAQYAKMPKPQDVMIIDSRPYKTKFVKGFIPTAESIPASQFEKMTDKLPENKDALLIFYCGGLHCPLSHKSAYAAEKLGYTNVKVYAEGFPNWKKNADYYSVGMEAVKNMMAEGEPYMLVDSRPHRKFLKGAVPSAVNIPDTRFDKFKGMLPADKSTKLVFYCGGFHCPLSHKSAVKAKAMGYQNVVTAEAGYPGWKELYGAGGAVEVSGGAAEGSIDTQQFLNILDENPDKITIVDVRTPEEYAAGHFPTAINIPVDELEDRADEVPTDKPIVFSCASGARAGEAYFMFTFARPEVEEVYYLEASNHFESDNSYEVKANK